ILSQLTFILYLIMYMLMFSASIYLRFSQPHRARPYRIPGGNAGMIILGGLGQLGCLTAFLFIFIPRAQIAVGSPVVYVGALSGLTVLFVLLPFVVYQYR
ncbi:amino acid permease, partial [Morganella morganii]|uniref:amino acid permease n=1 Tax=Morganella morganii TaxID=582 RepID=UPI0015F6265D